MGKPDLQVEPFNIYDICILCQALMPAMTDPKLY